MLTSGIVIQAQEVESVFNYTHQKLALLRSVLAAYSRAAEHDEFDVCASWEAFSQLEILVEDLAGRLDSFGSQLVEVLAKSGPLVG